MILILAEKPSAARNFAKALNGQKGTYKGNTYRIVPLRGHTLGLLPPDKQVVSSKAEWYTEWHLERLPWELKDFRWQKAVLKGCGEVLQKLESELNGVDTVCIATDVDPSGEGELLAWEALEKVGWKGPVERMYFADEAPNSVQKAFVQRKKLGSMLDDGDYLKASARERWDLASMQFTRAATCIARTAGFRNVVREGRLKSVMVALVGKQLDAYNGYIKKPFFEARFKDENGNIFSRKDIEAAGLRKDKAADVNLNCLHSSPVVIDSHQTKHKAPGKLLDLAGLSAILAKRGHKPESVLTTYQKMYEDQVVSYPRTEDKVVTLEQFQELLPLTDKIAGLVGVDKAILTHRQPRKTHVKEGGAHGANRPGPNVPGTLDALSKYGKEARDIYIILAKNWLAQLAEDYEYEAYNAHVKDFPEWTGTTSVPLKPGFKAVFDSEGVSREKSEGEEAENSKEFGKTAEPFVYEGANKRPPKPTMKWLVKALERYNVGTGATRTSTLAEITKNEDRALMTETKGVLALTDCGTVSYTLLEGCQIASPEATQELFEQMEAVGRFERSVDSLVNTVTPMVEHDLAVMKQNAPKLGNLKLASGGAVSIAKCPRCGQMVVDKGPKAKQYTCSSNKFEKQDDGTWKQTSGCGFAIWKQVAGKKLNAKQTAQLIENGQTGLIKGFTSKKGTKFNAKLRLDGTKVSFVFDKKS